MKNKISKYRIDQAAILCNASANWFYSCATPPGCCPMNFGYFSPATMRLSEMAYQAALLSYLENTNSDSMSSLSVACLYAEAEAMLRTGWTP